jgi:hypothetical protein
MKIKDPAILALFNKPKGSYTPADLAKTADISKYRKILQDPDSDAIDRKTAELMIRNYNMKLGALALAQESKKGFPQGIPEVSRPYMMAHQIKDEDLMPQQSQQEEVAEGPMSNPQEEMMEQPMGQYGYEMPFYSGDAMPIYDEYAYGGSLSRYQDKGEVTTPKYKSYTKDNLPAGARVRSSYSTDIKPGDYIQQPDGTYRKVSTAEYNAVVRDTKSKSSTAKEWASASPENKKTMDEANKIIEREIKNGTITNKNGNIKITGKLNIPFNERLIISQALNSNQGLGTDKYNITSQGLTSGFSGYEGAKPSAGSFVSGFSPLDYEKRYIYEKARGMGASHEDALSEIERVNSDPAAKAQLRKEYTGFLGMKTKDLSDEELANDDFYKKNYAEVTKGIEGKLGEGSYRPAYGNDVLAGFEHFDALGASAKLDYEGEPVPEETTDEVKTQEEDQQEEQIPPAQVPPASFWLQDTLKTAGAAANLAGIKKYMPWAPNVDLQTAKPTYLDPTRELAAQSEQANIASQANASFAGPQALGARNAAIQGAGAKSAADTLSRYNNANVNLANQFAWKEADVNNQESMLNQASKQRLYDQNTIANQQYDNAKRQAKNALLNQYVNSITNKEKTNALNQMYPQFAVDPSKGGRMYYTGQNKQIKPETSKQLFDVASKYKNAGWKDEVAFKMAKDELGMGNPSDDLVDVDAYNQMYSGMKKGGTQFAYVMGANVFPPFFY